MSDTLNFNRRELLGAATLSLLGAQLPASVPANASMAMRFMAFPPSRRHGSPAPADAPPARTSASGCNG